MTPNETLLLEALEYLKQASRTSDPALKAELLEKAHELQGRAEIGILEDLRRALEAGGKQIQ